MSYSRKPIQSWAWPPIAALFGYLLSESALARFLGIGILVLPHEFGHAFAAWAGSMPAIPSVVFETRLFSEQPSIVFGAVYFSALSAYLVRNARQGRDVMVYLCTALIGMGVKLTFFSDDHQRIHAFVIGGIGGELILCGLFVSLFFYKVSDHPSWRIKRHVLLFWGFFGLFHGLRIWLDASHDSDLLPMGTAWGGPDDENGDLQRLFSEFGWTSAELVRKMTHLSIFVLGAVFVQYAFFLQKEWKKRRQDDSTESEDSG